MVNGGFVVVVGVVAPGREVHPVVGPGRGGRVRWEPAGLAEDEDLADAMARLLRERSPGVEARALCRFAGWRRGWGQRRRDPRPPAQSHDG